MLSKAKKKYEAWLTRLTLYKVVDDASTGKSWVHWYENKADSNAKSPISYAEFVRRTGLHLLPN